MASPIYNNDNNRLPFGSRTPRTPSGPIPTSPPVIPPRRGTQQNTEKYPGLIQAVSNAIAGYGNTFKNDEDYARVSVSHTMEQSVRSHIEWMLTREGTSGDVNLRDVNEFSSYVLFPPIEEPPTQVIDNFELTVPDRFQITPVTPVSVNETDFKPPEVFTPIPIISEPISPFTGTDRVDIPSTILVDNIPFEITPLPLDIVGGSPISGEGSRSNPSLGSSTSRGGVLGGGNFSNPQDAIDNEFRFRTRITERER
jgi:hypothetical protein